MGRNCLSRNDTTANVSPSSVMNSTSYPAPAFSGQLSKIRRQRSAVSGQRTTTRIGNPQSSIINHQSKGHRAARGSHTSVTSGVNVNCPLSAMRPTHGVRQFRQEARREQSKGSQT
jgi:hypothetical protein